MAEPKRPARPSYKPDNGAPKQVSRGTVSKPTALPKPSYKPLVTNAPPTPVQR